MASRRDKMVEHIRSRTKGLVSEMLAGRLAGHLQAAADDDLALRLAVDKIRVSLRLFVDAAFAEEVAAELARLGKL